MRGVTALILFAVACGDNRVASDARVPDAAIDAVPACDVGTCDDGDPCTNDVCGAVACLHVPFAACAIDLCTTACTRPDTDGDGLTDAWETNGFVDENCNGVNDGPSVDLELPGANPASPDVYLEYDYMAGTHSHAPSAAAVQAVIDAFARRGIALRVDPVHEMLPHAAVVTFDPVVPACAGNDAVNFYDVKTAHFDHRRVPVYHYAIFGHYNTCATAQECGLCTGPAIVGSGGIAELPGNDLIISLGVYFDLSLTPAVEQVAGVIMHELGHNLGLRHAGDADVPDFKPNYLSVMDGNFTYPGIPVATTLGLTTSRSCVIAADCPANAICGSMGCTRIDYSGTELGSLVETSLDETAGINAGTTDITTYNCPDGSVATGAAQGPIDWNCNMTATESSVGVDIDANGAMAMLTGYNDWGHLLLKFQCIVNSDDIVAPPRLGCPRPGVAGR